MIADLIHNQNETDMRWQIATNCST